MESDSQDNLRLPCNFCEKTLKNHRSLCRHQVRCHKGVYAGEGYFACKEPKCIFRAWRRLQMREHLRLQHGMSFQISKLEFMSMKEFMAWKKQEEQTTRARYVLFPGKKYNKCDIRVSFYYCSRTCPYKPQIGSPEHRKSQLMSRMDCQCTSSIKLCVNRETDHVQAEYCATHYGHAPDTSQAVHVQLLKKRKRLMAALQPRRAISAPQQPTPRPSNAAPRPPTYTYSPTSMEEAQSIIVGVLSNAANRDMLAGDSKHSKHRHSTRPMSGVVVRDDDDHVSMTKWVEDLRNLGNNDFVVYKPKGFEAAEWCLDIEQDDFLLVIQTKFQQQRYEALGREVICLDSTHEKLTAAIQFDAKLTTVLCVDEWGEGVPVLWTLSSKDDGPMARCMFTVLKDRSPAITPKSVMTSDDHSSDHFQAFDQVFRTGGTAQRLLWASDIERTWQRSIAENLPTKEFQEEVYQELRVIASIQCPKDFRYLLENLLEKLSEHQETLAFALQFQETFANRSEEWAAWARMFALADTDQYVEAFFKIIAKEAGVGSSSSSEGNRRLDWLIDVLFKLDSYFVEQYARKSKPGRVTRLIESIDAKHRQSHEMSAPEYAFEEDVGGGGEAWIFETKKYRVTKHSCPRNVCHLACAACRICIHTYNCSCPEMACKKTICKHIHYVHRMNEGEFAEDYPAEPSMSMKSEPDEELFELEQSIAAEQLLEMSDEIILQAEKATLAADLTTLKSDVQKLLAKFVSLTYCCKDLPILMDVKRRLEDLLPAFHQGQPSQNGVHN